MYISSVKSLKHRISDMHVRDGYGFKFEKIYAKTFYQQSEHYKVHVEGPRMSSRRENTKYGRGEI